jgi:hypothetical protein
VDVPEISAPRVYVEFTAWLSKLAIPMHIIADTPNANRVFFIVPSFQYGDFVPQFLPVMYFHNGKEKGDDVHSV